MGRARPLLAALLLACGAPEADGPGVVVEADSPAIRDGAVAEVVGIRTGSDGFAPLLRPGCALPCERTFQFSTAVDGQTEIPVSLFRGGSKKASENHALGEFRVSGVPAKPAGQAQVSLTLLAADGAIRLSAEDASGAPLPIARP
jgi:molecular chaperone DnaK (HSP70)